MPVILAILGALFSGFMMWMVWGNGMQVLNAWIDARSARAKEKRDAQAIADARERAARAPLRAIQDPREAALVLLSKLAMLRGEITAEQNVLLSRFVTERFGFEGKPEHHTTLAAFAARGAGEADSVVADLTPILHVALETEALDDLFRMMQEVAALHGGPTEAQERMIERTKSRLNYREPEA
ncbi:hypothetical protein [Rhabdaerophilum sp. SD176]|uniref:hypothetical protein n=1 Tax=Rhabdaerophilum sp. SD176 TaxID=2983548 RepID=UPI0024DF46A4|nr:hypothetical protein [Rhabdaerophilum sp. SD176]